jgi:hypothetical protein
MDIIHYISDLIGQSRFNSNVLESIIPTRKSTLNNLNDL